MPENTDEPTVTHAVVRDKSIGERLRTALFPGFLTGGSASTLTVTKADENAMKEEAEKSNGKGQAQPSKLPSGIKPPSKNNNKDILKEMRRKQKEQENGKRFEGLFNSVLGLLGTKEE